MLEALRIDDEQWWRKFRLVAYEVWRKDARQAPGIESYLPIGDDVTKNEMTVEELDEIWRKYGKKKKR